MRHRRFRFTQRLGLREVSNSLTRCRLMACIMPIFANIIGPLFSAAWVTQWAAAFIPCSDFGMIDRVFERAQFLSVRQFDRRIEGARPGHQANSSAPAHTKALPTLDAVPVTTLQALADIDVETCGNLRSITQFQFATVGRYPSTRRRAFRMWS
jgi:hypothetical protein